MMRLSARLAIVAVLAIGAALYAQAGPIRTVYWRNLVQRKKMESNNIFGDPGNDEVGGSLTLLVVKPNGEVAKKAIMYPDNAKYWDMNNERSSGTKTLDMELYAGEFTALSITIQHVEFDEGDVFELKKTAEAAAIAASALVGAKLGAVIGSAIPVPGIGTLAGAAIGAGVGYLGKEAVAKIDELLGNGNDVLPPGVLQVNDKEVGPRTIQVTGRDDGGDIGVYDFNFEIVQTGFNPDPVAVPPPSGPMATSRKPGHLDVVYVDNAGLAHTTWWFIGKNDGWGAGGKAVPLPGTFTPRAPVVSVARGPENLDAFAIGTDGRAYTTWWTARNNGWPAQWVQIGGTFTPGAAMAATARKPGNLDVFATGTDGQVYTSWWVEGKTDGWGDGGKWLSLRGNFPAGAAVTATSRKPANIDVFAAGTDGRIYTTWFVEGKPDGWGDNGNFIPLGKALFRPGAQIAVTARKPANLDVFAIGTDGQLYTTWYVEGKADGWGVAGNWLSLNGAFPSGAPVAAVARKPSNLDVFSIGIDGKVYTTWFFEGQQDGWGNAGRPLPIGGNFAAGSSIAAAARGPENIDVFVLDVDGRVHTCWWTAQDGWYHEFVSIT